MKVYVMSLVSYAGYFTNTMVTVIRVYSSKEDAFQFMRLFGDSIHDVYNSRGKKNEWTAYIFDRSLDLLDVYLDEVYDEPYALLLSEYELL